MALADSPVHFPWMRLRILSLIHIFHYDEVMQKQRQLIYSMRDELLDGGRIGKERLMQIAENNIQTFVSGFSGKQPVSRQAVSRYCLLYTSKDIRKSLAYYLSGMKYWNESLIYSRELSKDNSTEVLIREWKEVIERIG